MNDYDNIDFCLNTLFDYAYNSEKKQCYVFKPIDRSNIDISSVKKIDFDDKHKKEVLDCSVKYMTKDSRRHLFKRKSDTSYSSTIAVSKVSSVSSHSGDIVDAKLMYLLSSLISKKNINYTILPIMNFEISFGELRKLNKDIAEKFPKTEDDQMMFVQIFEHYFKMMKLRDYLALKDADVDAVIFQVIFTLASIQEFFPNFRHNQLDLDNIFLYIGEKKDKVYKLKDMSFKLNTGVHIKLLNFYNSTLYPDIKNINKPNAPVNPYYDVHYFIMSLVHFFKDNLPKNLKMLVNNIVPEKYRYSEKEFTGLDEAEFLASSNDILTPYEVIKKNNFFSSFIINKMDFSISPFSTENSIANNMSKKSYSPTESEENYRTLSNSSRGTRRLKMASLQVTESAFDSEEDMYREITRDYGDEADEMDRHSDKKNRKNRKQNHKDDDEEKDADDYEDEVMDEDDEDEEKEMDHDDEEEDEEREEEEEMDNEDSAFVDASLLKTALSQSEFSPQGGNSLRNLFGETNRPQQIQTNRLGDVLNGRSNVNTEIYSEGGYSDSSEQSEDEVVGNRKSRRKNSLKKRNKLKANIPRGMRPDDSLEQAILKRLPEGYAGPVPDFYLNSLPDVNGYSSFTMPQMNPATMGMNGMMGMNQMGPSDPFGYNSSGMMPMDYGFGPSNPGFNFAGLPGYDINGFPTDQNQQMSQMPQMPQMPQNMMQQPMMMGGASEKKKRFTLKKVGEAK